MGGGQAEGTAYGSLDVQRVNTHMVSSSEGRGPEGAFVLADKVYKEQTGARCPASMSTA